MPFQLPYLIQNKKSFYSKFPLQTAVEFPPKEPMRGFGEPPERRTQGSAHKLKTDTTTVQSTVKGRAQGRRMRTQNLTNYKCGENFSFFSKTCRTAK